MINARIVFVAGALALYGCTTSPSRPPQSPPPTPSSPPHSTASANSSVETEDQKALGERIQRICALAEPERSEQIEKLRNESGFVLYCGK